MSSSLVPLKNRRVGERCTLNLSRAKACDVVARRGVCHLRCPPRHLTAIQNYELFHLISSPLVWEPLFRVRLREDRTACLDTNSLHPTHSRSSERVKHNRSHPMKKQAALIRQLEEELRLAHMRNPDAEVQQHLEALYNEKEHMTKEIFLLRETIKSVAETYEMFKAVIYYRERKILSAIDVSEKAGKVSKTTNVLDVHRLPTPLKTLKSFLRWYVGTCSIQRWVEFLFKAQVLQSSGSELVDSQIKFYAVKSYAIYVVSLLPRKPALRVRRLKPIFRKFGLPLGNNKNVTNSHPKWCL
ncbi:myosin-11-like protein [Trichonephila clavipes]|nr:myosin-11-like protein [Trichonephila clavipes]